MLAKGLLMTTLQRPQLRLRCYTLTPLIMMGAANNRDDPPELRAPSFRGVFRYWLRAILGSALGNHIDDLKNFEDEIMGSTGQGSPVQFQVRGRPTTSPRQTVLPPHKPGVFFHAFDPAQQFDLTVTTHPMMADFDPVFLSALMITLRLGAFGKRARRGGGGLATIEAEAKDSALVADEKWDQRFRALPKDGERLTLYIQKDIEAAHTAAERYTGRLVASGVPFPAYPILHPDHAKVLVDPTPYRTYQEALDVMWQLRIPSKFHDHPTFGNVRPRRASAVHMRLATSLALKPDPAYHPVMTIFRSEPEAPADWHVMQDFVDQCKKQGFQEIFGKGSW